MDGWMEDNPDPVFFLEKCQDCLAVYPHSEEELVATLRNVLHGTARDWWDVARFETFTWVDAFLSEDYDDELAERVQTRVQKEEIYLTQDKIYLTQELPIKQKPYNVSPAKLQVQKELIKEMLAADIIEPSSSAWASLVVLILKKTGGFRLQVVFDYRKLNPVTHSDAYILSLQFMRSWNL
ncbi:uncharacterized protein LOC113073276, partial [Tachysurus ichikawai]